MPTFKIKNLMIDVVSAARVPDLDKLCVFPTNVNCGNIISKCLKFLSCAMLTKDVPCGPCTVLNTKCGIYYVTHFCDGCSIISPIVAECAGVSVECAGSDLPVGCAGSEWAVIDLRKLVINPELIKEVQAELDEVLKAVAERGVEINKAMAPQTQAQAEALEKELTTALEEVRKLTGKAKK
ncbi:hypothetical protein TFLX_05580 [Thermoflexales bacterium]|nr:hypothetical protein TFLX_05580 [Thermoflexales bacterium]